MSQLDLSSEDRLLLYCARAEISDDAAYKIKKTLNDVIDWDNVTTSSIMQGISPLLYWNLSKIDSRKDIPANVMANLRKAYYGNLARNVLLYNELSNILRIFKEVNISVIVLKGAFLSEIIYKDIGLRPMKDIDLLIKEDDLQRVKLELAKLMYYHVSIFPSKLHEKLCTAQYNEQQYRHQIKNVLIEIHWHIQPVRDPFRIDINKLWENAKPVKIAGIETLAFAPEDLLLHLCVHLYKHLHSNTAPRAKPLRDYCDIAEVIRHYKETINWSYLLQSSKNYGIEEPIYQCIFVASQYFDAFIPKEFLSEIQPVKFSIDFENSLKLKMENYTERMKSQREINHLTHSYLTNLGKIPGIWNKIHILFADVFPCKEYMVQRYHIANKNWIYMFYLIRFSTALYWGLNVLWQLPHYIPKVRSEKA